MKVGEKEDENAEVKEIEGESAEKRKIRGDMNLLLLSLFSQINIDIEFAF